MIDLTRFNNTELEQFKKLTQGNRATLHRNCANRKHCDGCDFTHLCALFRDYEIMANKEQRFREQG